MHSITPDDQRPPCPRCGSTVVLLNGIGRGGTQNHLCRDCGRQFVLDPRRGPVGDEGFDSDKNRFGCLDDDTAPIIPNRKNRTNPWPFDEDEQATYKGRNCIERLFAEAKQFRRFATRYEKRKSMFMAVVQLVFGFIRMRKIAT